MKNKIQTLIQNQRRKTNPCTRAHFLGMPCQGLPVPSLGQEAWWRCRCGVSVGGGCLSVTQTSPRALWNHRSISHSPRKAVATQQFGWHWQLPVRKSFSLAVICILRCFRLPAALRARPLVQSFGASRARHKARMTAGLAALRGVTATFQPR